MAIELNDDGWKAGKITKAKKNRTVYFFSDMALQKKYEDILIVSFKFLSIFKSSVQTFPKFLKVSFSGILIFWGLLLIHVGFFKIYVCFFGNF